VTPFMARVAELIGADPAALAEPPVYRTRLSAGTAVNTGADRHIAVRALAEQLLCEAFAVFYRNRAVRISTRFADGIAFGQLTGDGVPAGPPRELASATDIADLLAALLVRAGLPHHEVIT